MVTTVTTVVTTITIVCTVPTVTIVANVTTVTGRQVGRWLLYSFQLPSDTPIVSFHRPLRQTSERTDIQLDFQRCSGQRKKEKKIEQKKDKNSNSFQTRKQYDGQLKPNCTCSLGLNSLLPQNKVCIRINYYFEIILG